MLSASERRRLHDASAIPVYRQTPAPNSEMERPRRKEIRRDLGHVGRDPGMPEDDLSGETRRMTGRDPTMPDDDFPERGASEPDR